MVRGDHAADYGSVVAAMVLLQQAGVPSVGLVTEPPDSQ
jgi:biopolymer transport protein TolR